MKQLTRQEYNLILRSFDYYDVMMNTKEKELRDKLEDKLYNNFYNPKDKVTQNNVELPDLNINLSDLDNVHSMKDYSRD